MQITLALKKQERAKAQLIDLMGAMRVYGQSYEYMLTVRANILSHVAKCPHWVKAYLEGYWDALTAENYRFHLVFGGMIDGKFYSTHQDREDYYEKHGLSPNVYSEDGLVKERGHYWKNNLKPFFISKKG